MFDEKSMSVYMEKGSGMHVTQIPSYGRLIIEPALFPGVNPCSSYKNISCPKTSGAMKEKARPSSNKTNLMDEEKCLEWTDLGKV